MDLEVFKERFNSLDLTVALTNDSGGRELSNHLRRVLDWDQACVRIEVYADLDELHKTSIGLEVYLESGFKFYLTMMIDPETHIAHITKIGENEDDAH